MMTWPANANTAAWYYLDLQEATNSHHHGTRGNFEYWTELLPARDWTVLIRPDSRPEDILTAY